MTKQQDLAVGYALFKYRRKRIGFYDSAIIE